MEYTKCLVEVYEVMKYFSKEDIEKIPSDVLKIINDNKDRNYEWKYDESKSLKQQDLNRTSIAILSFINLEYLLNEEQKQYINELHRNNEGRIEQQKQENNMYNDLFKNNKNQNTVAIEKTLIEHKNEKWYKRIIESLKGLFRNKKNNI